MLEHFLTIGVEVFLVALIFGALIPTLFAIGVRLQDKSKKVQMFGNLCIAVSALTVMLGLALIIASGFGFSL